MLRPARRVCGGFCGKPAPPRPGAPAGTS